MKRARAAAVAVGLVASFVWPSAGRAQVSGPCTGSIAGRDISSAPAPDSAIELRADQVASVTGTATGGDVTAVSVYLEFLGFRWRVAEPQTSGSSWAGSAPIDRYSAFGVGLYRVIAEASGPGVECSASAYVRIVGRSPLRTTAGSAGAVLALLGGSTLITTLARRRGSFRGVALRAGGAGAVIWGGGALLLQQAGAIPLRPIQLVGALAIGATACASLALALGRPRVGSLAPAGV